MSVKTILKIGNNDLRKKSSDVSFEKDPVSRYIHDLRDTLVLYQKKHNIGRAIAAPQAGLFKKLIFMKTEGLEIIMINPVITSKSEEMFEVWDSCFSAETAFFGKTLRHKSITVKYFNENNESIEKDFHDDLSELFQHEIDHLEGILFTDRIIDNQIMMRSEWEKNHGL